MEPSFAILLTDRNRHVRELFRRELSAEGYRVEMARDGREVLGFLYHVAVIDLLILDPDIPYVAEVGLLRRLGQLRPELPVIIHSFSLEDVGSLASLHSAAFLEKNENTDRLKSMVREVLERTYPDRVEPGPP
ncbi:MAG: response regulator [Syntrophobacteraceae bacterium]|jgi:DNA-binding NtrC family response regulator|nr:response regulator [Syntrophobacteraceae bacterium]